MCSEDGGINSGVGVAIDQAEWLAERRRIHEPNARPFGLHFVRKKHILLAFWKFHKTPSAASVSRNLNKASYLPTVSGEYHLDDETPANHMPRPVLTCSYLHPIDEDFHPFGLSNVDR